MTDGQRETLVREVFRRITIDRKDFVSIESKTEYVPLFAVIASGQKCGYLEFDPPQFPRPLGHIGQFPYPRLDSGDPNARR